MQNKIQYKNIIPEESSHVNQNSSMRHQSSMLDKIPITTRKTSTIKQLGTTQANGFSMFNPAPPNERNTRKKRNLVLKINSESKTTNLSVPASLPHSLAGSPRRKISQLYSVRSKKMMTGFSSLAESNRRVIEE